MLRDDRAFLRERLSPRVFHVKHFGASASDSVAVPGGRHLLALLRNEQLGVICGYMEEEAVFSD